MSSKLLITASKLGIPNWNPMINDLEEHICSLRLHFDFHDNLALTEKNKINLLWQTLPAQHSWARHYVQEPTFDDCAKDLLNLICGSAESRMSKFFILKIRNGENIPSYFHRIKLKYASINGIDQSTLDDDEHSYLVLKSKITDAIPDHLKSHLNFLITETEPKTSNLEKALLKLCKENRTLITGVVSKTSEQINVVDYQTREDYQTHKDSQANTDYQAHEDFQAQYDCECGIDSADCYTCFERNLAEITE